MPTPTRLPILYGPACSLSAPPQFPALHFHWSQDPDNVINWKASIEESLIQHFSSNPLRIKNKMNPRS